MPWLETWAEEGSNPGAALEVFQRQRSASLENMIGTWRGSELPTGHPMDGLLALYGWRGKRFIDTETVDPLLFERNGDVVALDPGLLPLRVALSLPRIARTEAARGAFRLVLPLMASSGPRARLRMIKQGDTVSAAMIYDALPIIDHFRQVDETRVLGMMDLRFTPRPFFFLLTREGQPSGVAANPAG